MALTHIPVRFPQNRFSAIDMRTTTFLLRFVKRIFPSFEFTWLGEEMEQNLPLEMDFRACSHPSWLCPSAISRRCEAVQLMLYGGAQATRRSTPPCRRTPSG